jgi:flagellar biosynthesis component FlhA
MEKTVTIEIPVNDIPIIADALEGHKETAHSLEEYERIEEVIRRVLHEQITATMKS